jgi:Trk K+ transport system NAD-binding subunit
MTSVVADKQPPAPEAASWLAMLAASWKAILPAVIFVTGTIGFTQIEVTGGHRHSLLGSVYQALKLFVLGPDGMPAEGPAFWLVLMWILYFVAPGLTAAVVIEGVYRVARALKNPERTARKLKNHLIVCGLGKHGRLIVNRILSACPYYDLVVVDRDPALPPFLEFLPDIHAPVIRGDMADPSTLRRAGIDRAQKVFALSGHDVVNLNTCLGAKQLNALPTFHAIALVSDVGLSRGVSALAKKEGVITLNPYEVAASNLVTQIQAERGLSVSSVSGIVIAGFGRFGQMLAKALLEKRAGEAGSSIVVIDRQATKKVEVFRRNYHLTQPCLTPLEGEIDDPRMFEAALGMYRQAAPKSEPLIILCTDDDAGNLNTALLLREHWGIQAIVVTRLFSPPPKFHELTAGTHVQAFQLSELIARELPAECY